jgi:hypothetical protein
MGPSSWVIIHGAGFVGERMFCVRYLLLADIELCVYSQVRLHLHMLSQTKSSDSISVASPMSLIAITYTASGISVNKTKNAHRRGAGILK